MTTNHAAAAKMIRTELKKNGIPARVTAKSYAGGSSVTVRILRDVLPATRKEVEAFANRFQYGHFDGMTDCYHASNSDDSIPQVKYVFVEVEYSNELIAAAKEYAGEALWPAISGVWGSFWTQYKPRVTA